VADQQLYRTYVLWGHSLWAVSVPLLTWLAYLGISIVGNLSCTPVIAKIQGWHRIVIVYYIFPICTNAICTLLIIGKLLAHRRMIRKNDMLSNPYYGFIITVVAESGLLYAAAGIAHVVLNARLDPLSTLSGSVFTAAAQLTEAHIILRITLGIEVRTSHNSEIARSALMFGTRSGKTSSHAMRHIAHKDMSASSGGFQAWTESNHDNESLSAVGP
jgi:hypothetical protein